MSEIMRAVLNMPPELWSDDPIDVAQRHSIYKSAWREIDRLQAIVDRLLKTEDMVPIVAGMEAFSDTAKG